MVFAFCPLSKGLKEGGEHTCMLFRFRWSGTPNNIQANIAQKAETLTA